MGGGGRREWIEREKKLGDFELWDRGKRQGGGGVGWKVGRWMRRWMRSICALMLIAKPAWLCESRVMSDQAIINEATFYAHTNIHTLVCNDKPVEEGANFMLRC